MVLDGSKEASLPSCGDKPSLALQQRVTHSIAQWRILGRIGLKRIKKFVFCFPSPSCFRSINQMHPLLIFGILHSVTLQLLLISVQGFARWMYSTLSIYEKDTAAIEK